MFPLFIDLKDRKCVVVGGGKVAARKIRTLMEFHARVVVISPRITDEILELKQKGLLSHLEKEYGRGDLDGAFLAIAATPDREVNARVAAEAVEKNIFINVADDAEKCTFLFPSIVKKKELAIGITTSGSFPALSRSIREKIEDLLANIDDNIMDMLRKCRERASEEIKKEETRKVLFNRILEEAVFSGKGPDSREMAELKPDRQEIVRLEKDDGWQGSRQEMIERIFCEVRDNEKID